MKNLINYITRMDMEYKVNTRLDMLTRDGSPGHIHMINYFTKNRNQIYNYAIIKSDEKPSSIKELTILHLHSYLGMRGYIKGIGAMSAKEKMAKYENGIGAMSAEERMAAYGNGIGAMSAEERMAASEKGYKNGIRAMSAEERMVAYDNGIGAMSAKERMAASEKGYENGIRAMSAEERMAARKKGHSDCVEQKNHVKMGIAWEKKYADFESYDGMPERGTLLFNWQQNQLSIGAGSLNAKIREERAENKGSTIWSERRVKLSDCVEKKNRAKMGIAWEKK
jgi:hypothetical protein